MTEEKTRFKMYKAKKRWVVAGVTMFSAVLGTTALASADTVNSTPQVKVPVASSVVSSQNNSTSKTNASEVSTESQNNETKQIVSSNQGSEQQVPSTPANSSNMVKKATVASATTISSTPSVPVKTVAQNNNSVAETPKVQANSETVKTAQAPLQSNSVSESKAVSSSTDNVSKTSVSTTSSSTQNSESSAVSQSQEPAKVQSNAFSAPKASQINPATAYRHQLRAYQQSFSADVVPSHSTGIDVSDYQDNDVIYTLHNDGAKFVIVKTSQGMSNGGAAYAGEKIQIAKNLGMEVQGYHYATFGGNVAQAQREGVHAVANAKYYGVPTGSYLACDYETGASGSVSANTQAVEAFMDEVKKGGYIPLLYSGYYYLKNNINYSDVIRRYGNCLWIADYNGNNITPDFEYFPSLPGIIMWQFSDNDHGVDGDVCVLPLTVSNGQSTAVDNTPSSTPVSNSNQNTGSESTWTDAQGVVWHNETGTFTTNTPVNLRWGATPQSSLIATLSAGSQINYDAWADSDGYVWLRQPRNDGYGYLAAGLSDGSQKFGTFDNGTQVWNNNYTGQKEVNGHWQYWQNGTPVKNAYEWINDQSKETYYDGNGNMVYGQQDINGHWQYFDPETGAQAKNKYVWLADQNKEVYYNGLGNMVYGQQEINGHWQYFDPQSGAQAKNKYVWLGDQNKEVYYDGSGNMVYGQQKINGYWQYFDPQNGAQAKNKYVWLGDQNKEVYYDGNGNMVYGQQDINGHWQYFDPETGAQAKNKYVWIANQNKEVYYDGSGNMVYGQQKINGYWQYFGPQSGAQAKNKYVWLGNQNKEVFYDGNGNMVYGWQKNLLNNHATQYFDPVTGAQYKSGKYTIDGKQYTFDNYGNLVGGNNNFAVRQTQDTQNGWQESNGKVYYYKDGKKVTGWQNNIDNNGQTQYFGTDGAQYKDGYYNIDGQTYYFDKDGNVVKGWQDNLPGALAPHYFDPQTGAQVKNGYWDINGKECYFDKDGNYVPNATDPYQNGAQTGVYRVPVTTHKLSNVAGDAIRGMDISSYEALKQAGVKFYNQQGQEEPLMKILHDNGINYIRLRIWNDPSQQVSWGWGGGNADEANELAIAKEAAQYGIKVMVDFHYSDWWSDPGTQAIPKAWQGENHQQLCDSMTKWTEKVLTDFKNAGADVGMVQIGNEITNGFMDVFDSRDKGGTYKDVWNNAQDAQKLCDYLNAGAKGVRAIDSNALVAIHLETPKADKYNDIMNVLQAHNVDYDVLGSSFYPYWQGLDKQSDFNDLKQCEQIAKQHGKYFAVLETAWPFTLEDSDGCKNNIGPSDTDISKLYPISPQGQADELEDVYNTVMGNDNGLGAFYWEPAWIAVKAGMDNWNNYNSPANKKYGTESGWDNQAFFGDHGRALQSLNTYNQMVGENNQTYAKVEYVDDDTGKMSFGGFQRVTTGDNLSFNAPNGMKVTKIDTEKSQNYDIWIQTPAQNKFHINNDSSWSLKSSLPGSETFVVHYTNNKNATVDSSQTDTTASQPSDSSSSLPNSTANSNSSSVKSYVWNNNVNFVVESVDKDGNITLNVVGTYHDSQTKSSDFVEEQNTVYQNAIKHLPNGYKVEGAQALDAGTQSSVANGVKTTTANWNITVDPVNSKQNTDNNKPATSSKPSGSTANNSKPTTNSNSSTAKPNTDNKPVQSGSSIGQVTWTITYQDASGKKIGEVTWHKLPTSADITNNCPKGYHIVKPLETSSSVDDEPVNGGKIYLVAPDANTSSSTSGSTSTNKPATSDTGHSQQPANNPNDVNHDMNGNSSSPTTTKPTEKPTDNANTNTSSSSSSSAKPSSETPSHSAQPANNPNDVNHDVNGNDTTTDNKNNAPTVNPSAGNSDEDKPVQKPDGTVAKNPDNITSGNTEPSDDNHSDVNNSGSSSTESTSATESTNVDKQSNSANSNSVSSTDSVDTSVLNNAEPIATTIGDNSSSTSDKQAQESNNSNDSTIETSKVASQPQQLVEKPKVSEVDSNSTTISDNDTQSQAQSVVETAYKPVNRPMTQTEQMVVDANNENNNQAANNSEQGQNVNAKVMPQTGESSDQAMAEVGLAMLGVIATVGLAIDKKRFS